MKKISQKIIPLAQNQFGITIFQIAGHPFYGLQYYPDSSSPIWRNFLHLSGFQYTWKIPTLLSTLKIQLKTILNKESQIILPYSGGMKSTVLALLLSESHHLSLRLVDTGFFRFGEIERITQLISSLGLKLEIIDGRVPSVSNQILPIITQNFTQTIVVPTVLTEENLPWKGTSLIQPFRHLYREELKILGGLLNLSPKILECHPFPPLGLAKRWNPALSCSLETLKKIDTEWSNYLLEKGYYYQIYQTEVFWITPEVIGISAKNLDQTLVPLPTEFLLEFGRKVGTLRVPTLPSALRGSSFFNEISVFYSLNQINF